MEAVYIDTNIWIDFWEDRKDSIKPLGEFAFQLLRKVYECKYSVVVSATVVKELEFNYSKETVVEIMKDLRISRKYKSVEISDNDEQLAKRLANERKTAYNDTLHAVIANKSNAKYLVTRNLKDFEALSDLAEAKLPEDLL